MKVCVVAEFYPRVADPVLGVWAHRQAVAARDAGAEVHVVVLHRPIPPSARLKDRAAWRTALGEPRRRRLDGLPITTVRYLSPNRSTHYGRWGTYAAPQLALTLHALRRRFAFDLVHAHNAVPTADAVLKARIRAPLVVSVHGGDVLFTARQHPEWTAVVEDAYRRADLVLANSEGTERLVRAHGARRARVVHLGTDVPARTRPASDPPTIATVSHLIARKRHADVLRALWVLRERHPRVRYLVVGDGPERSNLERLARDLGLAERVEFTGQLDHRAALERTRDATVFAMPSVDEAFGVAYVEAMAAGVPALGALGEPGPAEIAHAGDGIVLAPPGDPERLAGELDRLLSDRGLRARLGASARATVERSFTWDACGAATVRAYEDVLAGRP
ncbi:glycosyltransferase [Conexibacter sp. SYSU D00693]|uniref:glycosyltransferase n=1 Tax=Conexibacter sp. SYSU D00693 TaxID=2812560 RepID=UPI00196B9FD5|nr:glycosyltransferase [Conexibacter sp. SYSU D00693]